jgi:hypothetical protein
LRRTISGRLNGASEKGNGRTDKDIMKKRIRTPLTLAISTLAAICIPLFTTTSAHAVEASAVEASAPHALASPVPPPGWWYHGPITLSVKASHRCLDADTNGGGVNGNKVQIWDCNDETQQWWNAWEEGSSGVFVFVNVKYNKCLDQDTNTYARDGGKVQLWDCNWLVQQQWTYDATTFPSSTSWYPIRMNGAPGVVLDAYANSGYVNGTKVQVYSFLNRDNQEWHSWPAG